MATPRRLGVYVACPAYAGNGGYKSMHPDVTAWMIQTFLKMRLDERVSHTNEPDFESDTPITMVRNNYVLKAREAKCDLLLMVDSDQHPLLHRGENWYKPFWETAFNAIYEHYDKGPLIVGAPYCGPPNGTENVYVFYQENKGIRDDETAFSIEAYPRTWAAQLQGLQECIALPTGLILIDMRIFDMMEPDPRSHRQILEDVRDKKLDIDTALRCLSGGWFYYEWKNQYAAEKVSTEDVTFTRDAAHVCLQKLGYNPLRCAWDSWIGHHKPWCVGKPQPYPIERVGAVLRRAVEQNISQDEARIQFEASPKVLRMFGEGEVSLL